MKKIILLSCWLTLTNFTLSAPPCCNYVQSNYYQLIYEADIAFLSGEKDRAYEKIAEAESTCQLIEQPMFYEISRYIELLVERDQFEKAIYYITLLVQDYGYMVEKIEKERYFSTISQHVAWDSLKIKLDQLSIDFYGRIDTLLIKELTYMFNHDQTIRIEGRKQYEEKELLQRMRQIDSMNENRIKEVIEKYGYPNTKLLGQANERLVSSISTMLMHFRDTTYFNDVLLKYIMKGECTPQTLGQFVDSRKRFEKRVDKYIYSIYSNVSMDEIRDIANLDTRRQAIGLPSMEMLHRRDSIIAILYGL